MLRFFRRLLLWLSFWHCRWHKGEPSVSYNPEGDETPAYCPYCSRMLDTKECARCGRSFIDWKSTTGSDDVMASAMVNEHGDVCCTGCYVPERDDEEAEEEACDGVEDL